MTLFFCVAIVCLTGLYAQHAALSYSLHFKDKQREIDQLADRLSVLEYQKEDAFDKDAFDDLKSKVEALRISAGLKRG